MVEKSKITKKSVFILMKTMNIGGAERSLLGLLNAFDYNKYTVTLLIYQHGGEFMKHIPKEVNLLPYNPRYDVFEVSIRSLIFSKRYIYGLARVFSKIELEIYCRFSNKRKKTWIRQQYSNKYIVPLLPKIKGQYDLAINFLGVSDVLVKKVNANKKVGWIHTDYNQMIANPKIDKRIYAQLDYIANVSEECNKVFLQYYPDLKKKAIVIENILSNSLILKQAEEFSVLEEMPNEGLIKILSIGRFSFPKNFDNVPEICRNVLSLGCNVKWYLIGYGSESSLIRENIKKFKMESNVVILGKKENPYPYIKACDIYIQPSRYEGKAVTVREAQILKKPVVITNYNTSTSQIRPKLDGIIVPMRNKECSEEICEFLRDEDLKNQIILNYESSNFENSQELEKIEEIIKN